MVKPRMYVKQTTSGAVSSPMRKKYLGTTAQSRRSRTFRFPKPASGASTTAQAIRTGGWANPSAGGEMKFVDNNNTFNPGAGVATFVGPSLLNGIANGTDASTRIGRKAVLKSILLRITASIATATKGGSFRLLVVYDKQANATAPAITDILLADAFNAPNNLSNRDRFVTIFDQIIGPLDVGGPNQTSDTFYKKLNLEELWNAGTDALIGSITSGSIYAWVAQSGGMATNAPQLTMYSRVRYTDN
nr:capsid protein [Cressdnaviricota sp.]